MYIIWAATTHNGIGITDSKASSIDKVPYPPTNYDAIHYHGAVIPITAPSHLAICARWLRGQKAPFDHFRLVELGCGVGTNLLSLAFHHPDSNFLGIDSSYSQLDCARRDASSVGLQNIDFMLADVRNVNPADLAPRDYVIVHGLYSWVPDETRQAILALVGDILTSSGLAYISYNAQPGWSTRCIIREILLRARSVRKATLKDKAQRAIEVASCFLEDLPSRDYAHAVLLAEELKRVRDGEPSYVFHEYLTEVNQGFWFGDFVECVRRRGLDYVGDAQFCRWEGHVPTDLKHALAKRNLDPIEQEEAVDLLGNRYFRASILCRADALRKSIDHLKLLDEVHIATSLHARSDPFDLTEGVVERFIGTGLIGKNELEVTLNASITKASMVLLAAQWPKGMRLNKLYQHASKLLTNHGHEVKADARSQLSDELIKLFEAGQIDLRLRESAYHTEVPEYPRAHALARFEAKHRETLTTPYHLPLPFEPQVLAMVRELDGSRSRAELSRIFGEELVSETLWILGRWGLLELE
jgi:methyltransferase-like protein